MELLTGEQLALDLLNTRAHTPDGDVDALDSAEAFAAWLATQAGRLPPPPARLTARDLAAARILRGHVEAAVDAARHGTAPPTGAVEVFNAAVRAAPPYRVLTLDGSDLVAETRRDGTSVTQLLAALAEAAVDLLTGPEVQQVRGCEGPGCRMLFLPAHPRRRWCSPARCGNRVRVARYYQRHK